MHRVRSDQANRVRFYETSLFFYFFTLIHTFSMKILRFTLVNEVSYGRDVASRSVAGPTVPAAITTCHRLPLYGTGCGRSSRVQLGGKLFCPVCGRPRSTRSRNEPTGPHSDHIRAFQRE